MYKPVKFITNIPYKDFITYYLFNKSKKILIPIEIDKEINKKYTPTIYNSMKRLIYALDYSCLCLKIYKYDQNIFYTYLSLYKNNEMGNVMDLNISFADGIEITKETNIPIYINEEIIRQVGIVVTRKLVEKALSV
jgi:bifunctional DNase/RNase